MSQPTGCSPGLGTLAGGWHSPKAQHHGLRSMEHPPVSPVTPRLGTLQATLTFLSLLLAFKNLFLEFLSHRYHSIMSSEDAYVAYVS